MLQTLFSPKLWGNGPKHPVGPSFSGAYERTKDLSGNVLGFKAPAPCGDGGLVATDEDNEDTLDIYDRNGFIDLRQVNYASRFYSGDALKRQVFLSSWQMNGRPLVDGYMGDLRLCINVRHLPDFPANESLFDPEILAREVRRETELNFLSDFHNGYNEDEWDFTNTCWPHYIGPLNWQWQNLNGRQWLYYEMQSLRSTSCPYVWNIALTDHHFLECTFYVTKSGRSGGNSYCREVGIASEPYLKLMHDIMSTLTLTRTPELAAHEQSVLRDHSDARLLLHPGPSAEQLAFAAHVMWKWSNRGTHHEEVEGVDYRAKPEDVAELIKQRLKPNPLAGHIDSAVFADDFPAGWMFTDGSRFERGN
ncbi:hypothetical protein G8770_23305 [Aestuariicella hydrocarbonica]|uniref:Uncharacterized protein n=1 Tax=Pseudomaricurvus hydrocarbonicus TaxID=1470433 RepID=A0A9E5T2J3_9GAMM|nr:hypothetical protein [Aestuariicella hydrocarbonica]NHO68490.1 hypothetical protein [Aestuariicella hydrocarbonica]